MTAKVEINIKDCPITSVQIYLDRAEVTRRVSLSGLDESQEEKEYSLDLVGMVIKAEPEVCEMHNLCGQFMCAFENCGMKTRSNPPFLASHIQQCA